MTAPVIRAHNQGAVVGLIEQALQGDSDAFGLSAATFVCVGDTINTDDQDVFLRGHGTQEVSGRLVATLCGVVERVNKLIIVKPLNTRYSANLGDVVVGRVAEIAGKAWRVDLNSRQEAKLLLSAVHLPGGVQRRRNAEDELNMRSFFREDDLISAEVQAVHSDGSVALHTRSAKYGKLCHGQLVVVAPMLVKRQKQHFHMLDAMAVQLIVGCNGLVWVAPLVRAQHQEDDGPGGDAPMRDDDGGVSSSSAAPSAVTKTQLEVVCRVANAVRVLSTLYMPVVLATIMDTYDAAVDGDVPLKDMLEPDFLAAGVKREALRRSRAIER